jgi:uncharacterized protein YkwD
MHMTRRSISIAVLVAVMLAAIGAAPAQALTPAQKVFRQINHIRANHGLSRLNCTSYANGIARYHSKRMAAERRMWHTQDLYSKLRSRTRLWTWGENVGYAKTVDRVVYMWMHSPSHRANILKPAFHRCGIGVAWGGGWLWFTQSFFS